jgi:DNA-binding MarR family transcriptional regulator
MTMSVGFILMYVEKQGSPSTSLGPKMGMEPTSLSRTLKTMEDQGLIRRQISVDDKRKVLIFLTPIGIEKRRMVRTFLLDFNQMIDEKVSDSARKGFFETMEAIDELTQKMN